MRGRDVNGTTRIVSTLAILAAGASFPLYAACGSNAARSAFDDGGAPASDATPPLTDTGSLCLQADCDNDGYASPLDCNDNDALVNPDAFDFKGDGIDNDCDGTADDPVESCETIPAQLPGSPTDFARAADLCAQKTKRSDGTVFDPLVKAAWGSVKGYGPGQRIWESVTKDSQVGIVSSFGSNATRQGQTMIGLANGPWGAKRPRESDALDDPNFKLNDACSAIPLSTLDCASLSNGAPAGGVSVQDWGELSLWIKVPSNAQAVLFDFAFFSSEFNQFWNASLNDAFFALVSSSTFHGDNVAKDGNGLAITVNSGFFQICPAAPGPAGLSQDKAVALQECVGTSGDAAKGIVGSVAGTGYDGAGSPPGDGTAMSQDGTKKYIYGGGSGWLSAAFPVTPGEELQLRLIILDTFDGLKDSAILLDSMRWSLATAPAGVQRPTIK